MPCLGLHLEKERTFLSLRKALPSYQVVLMGLCLPILNKGIIFNNSQSQINLQLILHFKENSMRAVLVGFVCHCSLSIQNIA